jgi:hypothetical protein
MCLVIQGAHAWLSKVFFSLSLSKQKKEKKKENKTKVSLLI